MVFDTTDRSTFEQAQEWIKDVKANTDPGLVLAIAGSKCDLEDQKAVTFIDLDKLAKEEDAVRMETSSKANIGVTELFNDLSEALYNQRSVDRKQSVKLDPKKKQKGKEEDDGCKC